MKIHKYKDYDEYIMWQKRTNKSKQGWVYIKESTARQISKDSPLAKKIICHGSRAGAEQKFFKKYLPEAEILGTEIGDNATSYAMTIQHDFNVQKSFYDTRHFLASFSGRSFARGRRAPRIGVTQLSLVLTSPRVQSSRIRQSCTVIRTTRKMSDL